MTRRSTGLDYSSEVVAKCLYGADINDMAIEMCKLSLWLVSLDRDLPFSFVDDKVFLGNSLLGLTDLRQLRAMHIDPTKANRQQGMLDIFEVDTDSIIKRAVELRESLASPVEPDDSPARSAAAKRRQLAQLHAVTADLRKLADGVVATGLTLGGKPGRALDTAYEDLREAARKAYPGERGEADSTWLDSKIDHGLTPTVETDYARWQPLHWIIEAADVMVDHGGFDAIIGNPPFLGGSKLTGAMGTNLRDWLVNCLAGKRGNGDLVAYFFLRATSLLQAKGVLGLIATNTVAQGDTREVGLDTMVEQGFEITRAIQSRTWPAATANLEYAAVWGTRATVAEALPRIADDTAVRAISTLLEAQGRASGLPVRLKENAGIAFLGAKVYGMGFVLDPEEAQEWIAADARNAEVLFPFLNGEDLNSRPDCSPSRWVIDFGDRAEVEAATYKVPYARALERVKPERAKLAGRNSSGDDRAKNWWKFGRRTPALSRAIADLSEAFAITRVSKTVMPVRVPTSQVFSDSLIAFASADYSDQAQVLAIALVSKTVMPVRVPAAQVFSHALGVFVTDGYGDQAVLSSSLHQLWAITYGSGMRNDPRYTPSDVFETFPRPKSTASLDALGVRLDQTRRKIMLRRRLGLTSLYNLVNDPAVLDVSDADVAEIRAIHRDLDTTVLDAYGWSDLVPGHGFHEIRKMTRWTLDPAARIEVLDRLLEENHRRAAALPQDNSRSAQVSETEDDTLFI